MISKYNIGNVKGQTVSLILLSKLKPSKIIVWGMQCLNTTVLYTTVKKLSNTTKLIIKRLIYTNK